MRVLEISSETQLRNSFNRKNTQRAQAGDTLLLKTNLTLSADLIIPIPVQFVFLSGDGFIDTNGHQLIMRSESCEWPKQAVLSLS